MSYRWNEIAVCSMIVGVAMCAGTDAQNTVSRPVGFVRVVVPAEGRVSAALPFLPFDASLDGMFQRQLTGPTNVYGEYRVFKWNPEDQKYVSAAKVHGSDQEWLNGTWLSQDLTALSDIYLQPGEGFYIEGYSDQPRNAYLWGDVLSDPFEQILYPGLNLLGYLYPSAIPLGYLASIDPESSDSVVPVINDAGKDAGDLPLSEDQSSAATLSPGSACWYQRSSPTAINWIEPLPGKDLFPTSGLPFVADMHINDDGNEIGLEIACAGKEGERLEVLYKDISSSNETDMSCGWKLADVLPPTAVELPEDARDQLLTVGWTDAGVGMDRRGRIDEVFGRLYMVGRSDIDSDEDGIPDCRESFIHGTDPQNPDSDGDGMSDGDELKYGLDHLKDDARGDLDGDGISNVEELKAGTDPRYARHTRAMIYVDRAFGSDAFDGFAYERAKQSIHSAIAVAIPGDTICVRSGEYLEGGFAVPDGVVLTVDGQILVK